MWKTSTSMIISRISIQVNHRTTKQIGTDASSSSFETFPVWYSKALHRFFCTVPFFINSTQAICSSLIAQAFQSIQYPILPENVVLKLDNPACMDWDAPHQAP